MSDNEMRECLYCKGLGQVQYYHGDLDTCPTCHGAGYAAAKAPEPTMRITNNPSEMSAESGDPPIPGKVKSIIVRQYDLVADLLRISDAVHSQDEDAAMELEFAAEAAKGLIERLGAAERWNSVLRETQANHDWYVRRVAELESKLAAAEQSLAQMHESADWYKQTTREQVAAHDLEVRRKARAEALEPLKLLCDQHDVYAQSCNFDRCGCQPCKIIRDLIAQEPPETEGR